MVSNLSTLSCPVSFDHFRAKTIGSDVAVCECNSGAESGRELFKGSKDVVSLLVCTWKKIFGWGLRIFWEWCQKWKTEDF